MSNDMNPIYIVDDEVEVLESMSFLLESYGYEVKTYLSGQEFLSNARIQKPGCVLLDSRMPEMRGQEVHQALNEQHSPLTVIYLTGHGDIPMAVDALKDGAQDFFQKPVDVEKLVVAIDTALTSSEKRFHTLQDEMALNALTKREKEVLDLVIKGMKNQQMADELCVSLRTIEVHRSNVMKKLEVKNVAALIQKVGHLV
ncbi:response regulator transcription factor [Vibrio mexicanus]|uniref:response regulator transcription factor n=1 Tax=Vibrio mexicanus TaxID=1004326 RepID=UPI00063C33AA|nr:response regulator [Vibrio mexicanus]